MADIHDLTALEQAAGIASKQFTAVQCAEHYLGRSVAGNDASGAFTTITADLALAAAADFDSQVARGVPPPSSLAGVVCPVKDLNLVAGVPTRFGTTSFQVVPDEDDNVTHRMRAGGLIFTGKTATPEFGLPCYTEPDTSPPARSPWGSNVSAGGSSGGAGAAVSFGLAPIAQGSDGGGSIRIPSAMTGLVGIKPTRGRVSNGPVGDMIGDLATNGPMARSVADAAALLDVMSGNFVSDPHISHPPRSGTFLAACELRPAGLRIGFTATPFLADVQIDADVTQAVEHALDLLVELGHHAVEIPPPFTPQVLPSFMTVWTTLAHSIPMTQEQEQELRPLTRYLRELGRDASGVDVANALSHLRVTARRAVEAMHDFDVVLAPTLARHPVQVGELRNDEDPATDFRQQGEFSPFCAPINIAGLPAINVPVHWTDDGVPIGVQLIGRMHDEETLIGLAAQMETAEPWAARKPAMW